MESPQPGASFVSGRRGLAMESGAEWCLLELAKDFRLDFLFQQDNLMFKIYIFAAVQFAQL
ncbi:hypothetical protein NF867_03400 [Solitalea sp. MAHUQ-68]|uniref:Uncharacterized protein n=1 Tax=Solitalea agri TaxID=2953739 RepID=A0A9X2F0J8_9SPHI|nr:hypothetical protein [Solitalea agri]MCO4291904.1 hypothetical protein [Solitalea agri]